MDKFRNKYRIPSSRWQKWDYGSNAAYYVTICTQHRLYYFGDVILNEENRKIMQFTEMGAIARQYWLDIPNHFPFVELDEFVIMPNHVHGIIIINKSGNKQSEKTRLTVETRLIASPLQSTPQTISKSSTTGGVTGIKNPMIYENLSRVIRWYKGRCSFEIRKIAADFTWQSRFHDRVIRNYQEYVAMRDYILHNIEKWNKDSPLNDFP